MTTRRLLAPALLVAALLLAACGGKDETASNASAPLAYAPAGTPYVFGMLEPMPDDVIERFMDRGERMGEIYANQFQRVRGELARKGGDERTGKFIEALAAEFEGKSLRESMALFGVDGHQRMAFYGIGLVPVLRMELADPAALPALIARMESRVGESLPTGKIADQGYWIIDFGEKDAPLMLLAAVIGEQLVITLSPSQPDDATLKTLLGMTPPSSSILDGQRLAQLQQRHHFLPSMIGEVDSQRLLDTLAGPATPLETAFLSALETEKPAFSRECRDEYGRLADLLPRVAFGFTRLDTSRMEQISIMETAASLATPLKTLRAPMPGMGAASADAAIDFGYSLKLGSIPALAGQFATAVNSAPFQCESLDWLNQAAAEAPKLGNNPGIYMAATVFSGTHLIIDDIAFGDDMKPSKLKGSLLVGSDNPQALLSMARQYVPQLSSLEVKTDGSLQKLDLPAIPDVDIQVPTWVTATHNMLGIAFGAGADADISARMKSDPAEQPLFVMGYDGAVYMKLMSTVMNKAAAEARSDEKREEIEQTAAMLDEIYGSWLQHVGVRIDITNDGIVFTQNIVSAP
ncbi:MAG: hypothetical protein KDI75_00205 [Xanthomonadales bacterium]|nr:hypothetical protein [Xanthomonadales bacterium]